LLADGDTLELDPQYMSDFEHGLAKMLEELESQNNPDQLGLFDET